MEDRSPSHSQPMTRRGFFKAAGAAAMVLGPVGRLTAGAESHAPKGFRFAHLTDIHVQPQLRAGEGFRACLTAVHRLKPRPDFLLTGGDLVMDVLGADEPRAKTLFDLYTRICRDSDIPIHNCVGNHDVFGWNPKAKISPEHVSYGKKMVMERLALPKTTYSFDHKGWHFCVVDDILPNKKPCWQGGISEQDLEWLDRDLSAAGDLPKVVCAHIPFISVYGFRNQEIKDDKETHLKVNKASVCRNPGPILSAFRKHKVNLALAGHTHENERIRYDGTSHIIQGAVSGSWWNGPRYDNPEGFGVIDVRADGSFEHSYHTYGWKAETK